MYNPKITEIRLAKLTDIIRKTIDPAFAFEEKGFGEIDYFREKLDTAYDYVTGVPLRALTQDEEVFVRHELNRCKVDFRYWATRYAMIKNKEMALVRLKPTAVQELLLEKISKTEWDAYNDKTGDGVLIITLKARQLGVSTFSDIIIAHRSMFYGNTTALIAADVEQRTENLYEMVTRVYDNSPWYLRPRSADPKRDFRVKNKQISWGDQDSIIRFGASKNLQGGDSGQEKGSLGTGQTLPLVHLSELALWNNPYQIDDALMPSIPMSPRTFAIFESTAKGRGNWFHENWHIAEKGLSRLVPVFIPWYTDPDTYRRPAPTDWAPSERALLHAERVHEHSAQWVGKSVRLTKDQLFWWERTRAQYTEAHILHKFLAEYTSDPAESFQNTTISVFPSELIDDMRSKSTRMPVVVEIKPKQAVHVDS